ncbi:MAG: hypothetical protein HY329_09680 [Chloroflexi bacterium]|nr:hypothetical protein [Chloroflexota bacterium]
MGMHCGILAADVPGPELLRYLAKRTGDFVDQGTFERWEAVEEQLYPNDDGFPFVAGELAGQAYLFDSSYLLSGSSADLVVGLSADTGGTVVGCSAETVSGTYSFVAARAGELIRHHYNCHADLAEPYDWGEPLPSEAEYPLEDLNGGGLPEGLRHFGFDYDAWRDNGTHRLLLYTSDRPAKDGPIDALTTEHWQRHRLPDDQKPPSMLVTRDGNTGRVLSAAEIGQESQRESRGGIWGWIRGLLG